MSLLALIRKGGLAKVANANPAKVAKNGLTSAATVATVADTGKAEKDASLPDLTNDVLPEVFEFSPPDDPSNDDEALQERAAIMAEGCGMDQAQALQEARWQADRERCWRAFLRNAKQILEAPSRQRDKLLTLYQIDATRRYGQAAGADMAGSLRSWIKARGCIDERRRHDE